MKYQITRTAGLPEDLRAMGFVTRIVIECGSLAMPDVGKAEDEPRENRAYFDGFELVLMDGDEITQVDA